MKFFLSFLTCTSIGLTAFCAPVAQTEQEAKHYDSINQKVANAHTQQFAIEIVKDGKKIMLPTGKVENGGLLKLEADASASKLAQRSSRDAYISTPCLIDEGNISIQKFIVFDPDSNYTQYAISMKAINKPVKISSISFLDDIPLQGAKKIGYTDGSVTVGDGWFLGVEHPMAKVEIKPQHIIKWTADDYKKGSKIIEIPANIQGDVSFTFDYQSGSHRLDIESVSLVENPKVADKHVGFAGSSQKDNVYTLKNLSPTQSPKKVLVEFKKTNETHSFGNISVQSNVSDETLVSARLGRNFELVPGQPWIFSLVVGKSSKGQERRCFQDYLEKERAHPYRIFPHYNSWYDLCISRNDNPDPMKRMTEETALKSMREFNRELYQKRGVSIESYLLDDGWDDWNSLWDYHVGFPNKFKVISDEVKSQKSGISAWLSPWGGYGGSKSRRVQNAQKMNLETPNGGLSLAQPKYYNAFRDRCLQMVKDYDMNMFKFDGIGAGTYATGADERVAPDLEGLVRLIADLRHAKQDLFINCTVGTWASPFWVLYADSIWRGGDDCDYLGEGPQRERWITYRDNVIYERFASTSPFFPLNSVMSHGIIVGNRSVPSSMIINQTPEATQAFANEVWMGIACGTGLQEYYISPDLMSQAWWDILATGIKWLRENQTILRDVHWVGGSPTKGEIYGYASYSPEKSILILRNPSSKTKTFEGDAVQIFEIPRDKPVQFTQAKLIHSAQKHNLKDAFLNKKNFKVTLAPFETLLVELK